MRALLAAVQCDKSALTANLAMHVRVLDDATRAGCDIAVFPEMSLTGAVDSRSHPDDAVAIDDDAVATLASATDHGAAALFGIAERRDRDFSITQIYAQDGRVVGAYRKRHLGQGEEGFAPGDKSALFHLGAMPFGVAICAEEFPGLAALVSRDGEIVARLPDWRPATLIIDLA